MNIFFLDFDQVKCAEYHNDKHVSKMICETAQLLSTAVRLTVQKHNPDECPHFWKATHKNHPSNIWVRESRSNFYWLVDMLGCLIDEYDARYPGRNMHQKTRNLHSVLSTQPIWCEEIPDMPLTPIRPAMPPEHREVASGFLAYRLYYYTHKQHGSKLPHKWTLRGKPNWLTGEVPLDDDLDFVDMPSFYYRCTPMKLAA